MQPHAARLAEEQESPRELGNHSIAKTMFAWAAPISPHAASAFEGTPIYLKSPNSTNHFTMAINMLCLGLLSSLQHSFDTQTRAAHALVGHMCAGHCVSDAEVLSTVTESLSVAADACCEHNVEGLALVETAGGPASPGPSGTLQVSHTCPTPCAPLPPMRPCPLPPPRPACFPSPLPWTCSIACLP